MGTTEDHTNSARPTIVLVHGAFADGSSWNGVIERLQRDGYVAVAPVNPLRGVTADSAYIASVGTVIVRSMAQRAGAHIVEASLVIMVSQPEAVTDVIVKAAQAVAGSDR
jgi:hypothetical protein